MDKNEQLQVILAQNKGMIFLSLVDRNGKFKEITRHSKPCRFG